MCSWWQPVTHRSFPNRSLRDPALAAARAAIDLVLDRQKPYPAFARDRHWCIAASNTALPELYAGVALELLEPPVNGLRLSLHPRGMAPRIVNLAEWRAHLLFRVRRQIEITADPVLIARPTATLGVVGPRAHESV